MLREIKNSINKIQFLRNSDKDKVTSIVTLASEYFNLPYVTIELIFDHKVDIVYINDNLKKINAHHNPIIYNGQPLSNFNKFKNTIFFSDDQENSAQLLSYNSILISDYIGTKNIIADDKLMTLNLFSTSPSNREFTKNDKLAVKLFANALIPHLNSLIDAKEDTTSNDYKVLKAAEKVSPIGYWSYNLNTEDIVWSHDLYLMLGADPNLPPWSIEELENRIFKEDQGIVTASVNASIHYNIPYCVTFRFNNDCDDEIRYYLAKGEIIKDDLGKPIYLVGTLVDISDSIIIQKQIKQNNILFKEIIDNINLPIAVRDKNFKYILVNQPYADLFRLKPEEIIGKRMEDIPLICHLKNVCTDQEIFENGKTLNFELEWLCPFTLKKHYFVINKSLIKNQDCQLVVISLNDITELKENIILREENTKIDLSNQIKSEFVANISHEIRNPLNALLGASELLSESVFINQDEMDYLNIIKDCSNLMLTLINEILDFSKIEAGKVDITLNKFDLYRQIISVINLCKIAAQKKNISLLLDYDLNSIPRLVIGDSNKVTQIIQNLVCNAVKFTDHGYVKITVTNIGNNFSIAVKDTGIGISDDEQSIIFDKFEQASNQISKKYGGTGLGLSISNKLADLMGGNITLSSKTGKGSTFNFNINFELDENIDQLACHNMNPQNFLKVDVPTILLAEDNLNNQFVISSMLKKLSLNVVKAENGKEVLEIVKNCPVDLILMDCQMPIVSGYEASLLIKDMIRHKEIKPCPIIAITAYASKNDKEKCLEYGMNDYIAKPIHFEDLSSKISKWLHKNHLNAI